MSRQLLLPLDAEPAGAMPPLPRRLALPSPTDGGLPFDDPGWFFEPWWPGTPALLRWQGRRLGMDTSHLADPLSVFPELRGLGRTLGADGVIVVGTLLALDAGGRPDAALLRRRLDATSDADVPAEGAFVASDLVYVEGRSVARRPFAERWRMLASVLADSAHGVLGRGLVGEGVTMGHAVAALGLDGLSARHLDGRWRPGPAAGEWRRLRVSDTPAPDRRPFLVLLETLPFDERRG